MKKKKVKTVKPAEGIEFVVAPLSRSAFFDEYFEKKPLVIARKDPTYYGSVFGTNDIRQLFVEKDELTVKKDLNICRVEDGARVDLDEDVLSLEEVWSLHDQEGFTLQVFQPQQRCLPLARLM